MLPNLFNKASRGYLCRLCWPDCETWPAGEKLREDAMNKEMRELQKFKGIGEVLSRRLIEAIYNTIAKVAAAEEHWLKKYRG
jgi:hypothetical protein